MPSIDGYQRGDCTLLKSLKKTLVAFQTKSTVRYYLTPVRMALSKRPRDNKRTRNNKWTPFKLLLGMYLGAAMMENSMKFLKK